ncbi:MAG: tetratricopeptide repeat protein [Ruminiclostridium sp.]|nr:tetratricopeptide repeat protein [Ruminiclostridium sp.]
MSERYEIIKEEELTDIWYKDFPIELNKTRLLYDNQTGNVLIQFKLTNVCTKIINTVYLKINCYDVSKTVVDSVEEHVIPMLSVKQNESFGDKAPAVSKDRRTADVNVIITKIVFSDGSVWENGNNYRPIQVHAPEEITFAPHIASRFKSVSGHLPNIRYMFREYDGYWRCTCGRINYKNADICSCCACKREELRNLFSEEYLKELIYQNAKTKMNSDTESEYMTAINIFNTIKGYKDSEQLIEECNVGRKECIYKSAVSLIEEDNTFSYESAKKLLIKITDWRNSKELIEHCETRIEEIKDEAEKQKEIQRVAREKAAKKAKRNAIIICSVVVAIIIGIVLFAILGVPAIRYNNAIALMDAGKYTEAISAFEALDGYKDSATKITECKYNDAVSLMENKNYEEAITAFEELGDYNDSKNKIDECYIGIYGKEAWDIIQNTNIGDTYILGDYYDGSTGTRRHISWDVIDKKGSRILVISSSILDCIKYDSRLVKTDWSNCTLRTWLNGTFYANAFYNKEKSMISSTTLSAHKNPLYNTDQGNATQDKIFVLSAEEVEKYLQNKNDRICYATNYASYYGINEWWLRTTGGDQVHAAYVDEDGDISYYGTSVANGRCGVRPAMWIDLSKI